MIVLILLVYSGLLWIIGRFPQQRSELLAALHLMVFVLYLGTAALPLLLLAGVVFYGPRWFYDQPRLMRGLQLLVAVAWLWIGYRLLFYQGLNGLLQAVGGPLLPTLAPVVYSWGLSSLMLQLLHYLQITRQAPGEAHRFSDYLAWLFFLPALTAGVLVDFYPVQTQLQSSQSLSINRSHGLRLASAALKGAVAWALFPWLQVPWEQWLTLGRLDQVLTAALSGVVLYVCLSGAADFAIVMGHWVGLRLPENFVYPFAQGHLLGFWEQWHRTLRQRLMELVYLPMAHLPRLRGLAFGGMMGLWGLWYGPHWHYLVGGLCMGLGLALAYRYSPSSERLASSHWSVYVAACVGVSVILWPLWLFLGMR
jgi:D-alanyl-lipoteichoic acid acyltransferase DltB (MBOAT superfamily)